jgi:hypothetical protein
MRARVGKIARLPLVIREELNRRLLENQTAAVICAWLNSLPETKQVIAEFNAGDGARAQKFPAGDIDDRNVSDWRQGGYNDWLRKRDRLLETREMAAHSIQLAKAAGGHISEGAAAIIAGEIMGVLEEIAGLKQDQSEGADPDALAERAAALAQAVESAANALASVRAGDHNREKLDQNKVKLAQNAEALSLDREKFQRSQAEAVLKAANDKAIQDIANSPMDYSAKIEAAGQHLFGEDWKPQEKS